MDELGRNSVEENIGSPKRQVVVVLDNVRSGNNVGSILRTADAMGIAHVHLCGITAQPPDRQVLKSSLGAEDSVKWSHSEETSSLIQSLKPEYRIWIVEQTMDSERLGTVEIPRDKPLALVFGNEVNGVDESLLSLADKCLEVPQSGYKHSMNVAVCAGMVLWEICRVSGD